MRSLVNKATKQTQTTARNAIHVARDGIQ